jgi:hypothetical protein
VQQASSVGLEAEGRWQDVALMEGERKWSEFGTQSRTLT